MTLLSELAKEVEAKARKDFVVAAWQDRPAGELLTLARAAGLPTKEADQLLAQVAHGRQLVPKLDDLPRLREAATVARRHLDGVADKNGRLIEELQTAINVAALAAQGAGRRLSEIEGHAQEVYQMHVSGLLPLEVAPDEVKRIKGRQNAREIVDRHERALTVANNRRNDAARLLKSLESQRGKQGFVAQVEALEAKIEKVKEELADAERVVEQATKAVSDARAAVPE